MSCDLAYSNLIFFTYLSRFNLIRDEHIVLLCFVFLNKVQVKLNTSFADIGFGSEYLVLQPKVLFQDPFMTR